MPDKYIFLDRDGVINKDPGGWTEYGYVTRPEDFYFLPGSLEAMKNVTEAGYRIVIISNQQGVGKGYFTIQDLAAVTEKMDREVKEAGGVIAGIYYCVHTKEENCSCRKPKPGLFDKAISELATGDISGRYYVGDTQRDIEAGQRTGLKTVLVLTGKSSREDVEDWQYKPDHIFKDLLDAVEFIIKGA